jgi:hypothetical protein
MEGPLLPEIQPVFPLVETAMVSKLIQPSVKTALAEYVKHCRALGSTSADYRGSL